MKNTLYFIFLLPVYVYKKLISPFLGNNCRFYPECSVFLIQNVKNNGIIKGYLLFLARIIRCNSLCNGGIDYPRNNVTIRKCFSLILNYKNNDKYIDNTDN